MIDNFKKRSVQGIIVAPTRELAVQIFRILRRLNDLRNAGKKRKLNPVTLRLAVGRVTDSYAAQVRENPGHIIVATPATLDALVNGVRVMRGHNGPREKAPLLLRPSINLRHVRMLVLDEVDHLCLPATWPRVERVLHNLNTTPSHGSMHRLGRIVLVSAALSQRVHRLTSPILHRPVTATAEGLLDGWVEERRMLRDRYRLPPNELEKLIENQQQQQQQRGGQGLERVGEEDEDVDIEQDEYADVEEEEEDDFDAVANADTMDGIGPSSMTPAERAAALEARLAARGINLSDLDPETRLAYEEADLFGDEDEEAEAERLAGEDARMQERERRKAAGEAKTDEEGGEEAQLGPLVRADDFLLPGSDAARVQALRAAAESGEEAQVNLEEEKLMPLLADYDAPPLAATSAEAEAAEAEAGEAAAAQSDASLPSATAAAVRYLPASMKHIAVHVAPSVKPMLSPYSTPEDRALVLRSWAKLLARMHAVLRPRVALVFFKRAQDALDLQAVLHTTRQLRSEVLLGGGGLRAPDRLRALESVLHGSVDFLLCTDLAARGLDMRGLTHVINFDVPATALDYVHRAGRVERLGGRKGCTVVNVVRDPREEGWSLKDTQRLIDLAQTIEQNKSVLLPQSSPADSSDANTSSIEAGVIDGSLLPSSSFPLPKRQGTFIGKSVEHMAKLQGQLHLDVRHVVLEGGQMHDLVTPPHVPRISTPATPKKAEAVPDLATGTHAAGSSIFSASGAVGSSAPTRSYSTFVRRLFGDARRA
jgi:superfamily II DNA/RNA helicase